VSAGAEGPLDFGGDETGEPAPATPATGPTRPPGAGHRERRAAGRAVRARLPGAILLAAGVVLLALVGLNTLRTHGNSSTGPPAGRQAPRFAAPLAVGGPEGDVNVAQRAGQGAAGARPACAVRGPGILNSCDLTRGHAAVLAFFAAGEGRCTGEVDVLARAARATPAVRVAAIGVRSDRGALRRLVVARRWAFPVAYDRDGALANLYGVAVCPQLTWLLPGGVVRETTVGALSSAALTQRLRALQRRAQTTGGSA